MLEDAPILQFLVFYAILLFSLSFHEAAHAIAAKWGGDMLSAYQGRISLNPLVHIDPIGTILMPALQFFTGLPLIGWAKPVPVNGMKFRRSDYHVVVALAGPFSNLLLVVGGILFAGLLTLVQETIAGLNRELFNAAFIFIRYFILINLMLMLFNLTPIPPLDGSHVLWHLYVSGKPRLEELFHQLSRFSFIILILLMIFPPYRWVIITAMDGTLNFLLHIFGGA